MQRSAFCLRTGILAAAIQFGVGLASAHAQTYRESLLHTFSGPPDGSTPYASLIRDAAGNLYGTTWGGGASGTGCGGSGCGTVFEVDTAGGETQLYSFTGMPDGANPYAPLLMDAGGDFYGTTFYGGSSSDCGSGGCGAVYVLGKDGIETTLYSFAGNYTGGTDGAFPYGGLLRDAEGSVYGTTAHGGNGGGVVFKVNSAGGETLIHTFLGSDGANPYDGLVHDAKGNAYGTTYGGGASGAGCGGSGCGTVFEISKTGIVSVLYSFIGPPTDGANPYATLALDAKGNLYGTTAVGGAYGRGTVFRIGKSGIETGLYSFKGPPDDGADPIGGLVLDTAGNVYGTTYLGGTSNFGTVFKVRTTGKESILYSFAGGADGANPYAGLVRDPAGNLYGTTVAGGATGPGCYYSTCGTVFELSPK